MNSRYTILALVIFFGLLTTGVFAENTKFFHPQKFLGAESGSIINRIGSLSIGSATPAAWLSDNTSTSFRISCINKWTTNQGPTRGIESCLDVTGGAAFDALFVNQPAYLIGKVVLNTSFLTAEPNGLVIGTSGHSGNSIFVKDFVSTNQNLRNLCATDAGDIYPCGDSIIVDPPDPEEGESNQLQCFGGWYENYKTDLAVKSISMSDSTGCAILADDPKTTDIDESNKIRCWGKNTNGDNKTMIYDTPKNSTFTKISGASPEQSCGINKETQQIECWENSSYLDLGKEKFSDLHMRQGQVCGKKISDGKLKCTAGTSYASDKEAFSEFFIGSGYNKNNPQSSGLFVCGIVQGERTVKCYGTLPDASCSPAGCSPFGTEKVTQISGDYKSLCALKVDGSESCIQDTSPVSSPDTNTGIVSPDASIKFSSIDVGGWLACGILQNAYSTYKPGQVYCWGQSVNDGSLYKAVPRPSDTFKKIAVGQGAACGITTGGDMKCWGRNDYVLPGGETYSDSEILDIQFVAYQACIIKKSK